ncbi:D-alanyl-D-alanine carboxypeptidase family protein [Patescibacteria group bacterium]|nr:D-alanyl-D-alanine carboxypeptidase family protein [Patescibacteria group bacterium]
MYSISDKNNKYYKWLENNAHKYGFHNTFQKGMDIDGQMEEGWHRRYVGK